MSGFLACWESVASCLVPSCLLQLCGRRGNDIPLAPRIRQLVLSSKGRGTLDIHTLLLCPDPTRVLERSYKMEKPLGKGGFGSVYLVRHLPTGEERAAKMMKRPSDSTDVGFVLSELQSLITLDHPNIEKFYEYFENDGALCLVTEICRGGCFSDLDVEVDSEEDICLLFRDVMSAIAYCHSVGVCHRDLKMENCLLTEAVRGSRRYAKVIDFGLSSIRPKSGSASWMSKPVGTAYYVAPEVIGGGGARSYGPACDVWSIGTMLYVTLTGTHPFAPKRGLDDLVMRRIRGGAMRTAPLNSATVPGLAKDLILKLLVKDPAQRLGARKALEHEWFTTLQAERQEKTPVATVAEVKTMLRRAQNFAQLSRFASSILTLVAHESESRDVERFRAAFVSLDPSRAGYLSRGDFETAVASLGIRVPDKDMRDVLRALDPDKDDRIQYTDWLAATIDVSAIASEKAILEVFNFFDLHGDGSVSRADLCEVLGDDVANDVLDAANPSPGGDAERLSLEDFRKLMRRVARSLGSSAELSPGGHLQRLLTCRSPCSSPCAAGS